VITDAPESPADEQRRRQRTYTAIMAVHIVGFALSGVLYYTAWWLGLVVLIVTTPLPWIAVVIANDRGRRGRGPNVTPPV
jgi:fatty acid desaturase